MYEGQVEVLHCDNSSSCAWRPACANTDWDGYNEATGTVVCRQLGLYSGASVNGKFKLIILLNHTLPSMATS